MTGYRIVLPRAWIWVTIALLVVALGVIVVPAVLVVAIAIGGVALAVWRPDVMLGVLAASVPVQAAGSIDVLDVHVTATRLCLVCLIVGWSFRLEGARVPLDGIAWLYGAVILALGTSVIVSQQTGAWASAMYQWTICLLVYLIARTEIRTLKAMATVITGMAGGVLGVSIHALIQVAMVDGPPSFVVNGRLRAYATFGEPNPLSAYLEMTLPVLIALAVIGLHFDRRRARPSLWKRPSTVLMIPVALGSAVLVLTQSRGGLLGFGFALIALVFFLSRRQRWLALTLFAALGAAVLVSPARELFFGRFTSLLDVHTGRSLVTRRNWATEERRAHWGAAWNMMIAQPWTGVGGGDFSFEFRRFTPEWRFRISRGHAHNGYLHLGAVAGVPGFVSFTVFTLTSVLVLCQRAATERDPQLRAIRAGCVAIVVAFAVHSLVDYLNVLSLGIQLALILAVGMAYGGSSGPDEGSTLRIALQMIKQ